MICFSQFSFSLLPLFLVAVSLSVSLSARRRHISTVAKLASHVAVAVVVIILACIYHSDGL